MLIDTHAQVDSLSCRAKSRHLWIEFSGRESEIPRLRELAKYPRGVAIGETGLDYHHLASERVAKEEQVQVMTALRSETDEEIEAQIHDGAFKSKQASLFQQQL